MGMFDSVFVPCPKCGEMLEFQSKEGKCYSKRYSHSSVPAGIARDLIGCDSNNRPYNLAYCCGKNFRLKAKVPRIYMDLVEWKDDEEEWD